MKNIKFALIGILSILLGLGIILSISVLLIDPNYILSSLVPKLEKEYHIKLDYKFGGKSIISIIKGLEFRDLKVFSNIRNKQKLLISSQRVYITLDLPSAFSSPGVREIRIEGAKAITENLVEYLNSEEFRKISSPRPDTPSSKPKIGTIRFRDLSLSYGNKNLNFREVDFNPEKFRISGYWVEGKSKFQFDRENFSIDRIDAREILGNVVITGISGTLSLERGTIKGNISNLLYTNLVRFDNISISGNIDKRSIEVTISNTLLKITGDFVSLTNAKLKISFDKGIEGNFALTQGIGGSFKVENGKLKGTVVIKEIDTSSLPAEVRSNINELVEDLSISGKIEIISASSNVNLFGNLHITANTRMNEKLFNKIKVVTTFRGDNASVRVFSKTDRSDLVAEATLSFRGGEVALKGLNLLSERIDISDVTVVQENEDKRDKKDDQTFFNTLPIKVQRATLNIKVGELTFDPSFPKVREIVVDGNIEAEEGKVTIPLENIKAEVAGIPLSGKGEVEYSESPKGNITLLPSRFDLTQAYSSLVSGKFGKVYGTGILENMTISFNKEIVIEGKIFVSNVELIEVPVQNELTKLLNLNLNHIFLDGGKVDFLVRTNSLEIVGNVHGDVVSEFEIILSPKSRKAKFKHLKVERSIIETVPKVLFLRSEIKGIKYKLDEKYLNFEDFEIKL